MLSFTSFVFGLLIGWLVEWVIDWIYWRRKFNDLTIEKSRLQTRILAYEEDKQELEAIIKAQQQQIEDLKISVSAIMINSREDDLQTIKGIGPVINGLLKQADIRTFAALSNLSKERLREILGDNIEKLANEESIITQARYLADENRLNITQ